MKIVGENVHTMFDFDLLHWNLRLWLHDRFFRPLDCFLKLGENEGKFKGRRLST